MKLFNFYQDNELHLGVTDGQRFVDVNRCGYPVTMMDVIKLTGASRNTLKQHFRNLTERNHLEQHGSGRGVWYRLK